ncbi:TRAP transporter small permease subunit [Marinobacterium rhizophilum]|uniref:TRAP transporter small permease protein n=1 Tax=Marinobacterium rhizophilum TaxID=420402 RepID=A0ABY5HH86_9GAMM|nr:TRAP transporter small permease [Marinobacterium rhizophilum]UTW11715.1 TRAP transporter small permease [Marinobacterium rhizophilum]
MIRLLCRCVRPVNQLAGMMAMLLIIYITGHILLEIILRLFGTSTFVLDEFVGYAVATMAFLGLGYALERGSLVRVNVLLDRLPSRWHWLPDLISTLAALTAFAWLSWFWGLNVWRSYQRGTLSETLAETPLWIPEGMVLLGMLLLCLTLLSRALHLVAERTLPIQTGVN